MPFWQRAGLINKKINHILLQLGATKAHNGGQEAREHMRASRSAKSVAQLRISEAPPMIEFRNGSKSFWTGTQRKVILDQTSFRINMGGSVGILAPNGTGKTTLINMMSGLEKPDEGEVIRTARISFPQGYMGGVLPKLNAVENSRYIAWLYGLNPDYVESFCRYICGLDEYFGMPIATYSRGMKARFMLAMLLALEFDIYLIDEGMPQSTDAEFNRKAGSVLRERLKHSTVAIVSHQTDILEKFCNSAALLRNGLLTMYDTLEEAKQVYNYAQ